MKSKPIRFAHCKRHLGETPVKNGLAVTPAQALKMAEAGLPISSQMQFQMVDGHTGSDWSLGVEERRGVDMATVWQESKSARKRLKSGAAAAVADPQSL